ncbi:unnamed protein product, partial [marine sediment metagenome]
MARQSSTQHVNRRDFLRRSAALGGVATLAGFWSSRSAAASKSANEKLNVAFVGSGGQAGFSLENLKGQNIVALCDVDRRRAAQAFKQFPKAKRYPDFRKMLDDMHREIDAVVVCTPDHMHAPASIRAM